MDHSGINHRHARTIPPPLLQTNPRPLQAPDPSFDYDFGMLDNTMMGLTANLHGAEIVSTDPSAGHSDARLVGGWFDPNDVPTSVRDHLLDLFFSRSGIFTVVFHVPRFYARLTLPPPKRPHPSLVYAMYLIAARRSTQPSIKQLETQFYDITSNHVNVSIANSDRLLDTVRAMALVVNYLFSRERYRQGYHMAGAAIRLAIACGLHRIPSSVWTKPPHFNAAIHFTLRTGGHSIRPAEDAIELAERIYAL
jgi:hypothetical protein